MSKMPEEIQLKKDADKELFHQFTRSLRETGLLDKTPIRGSVEIAIEVTGYILLFTFMQSMSPIFVGLFLVLLMGRSAFLAHDLMHKQYFSRSVGNALGVIFANVTLGIASKWWNRDHNIMHHTYTNAAQKDIDIQVFGGALIGEHNLPNIFHKYQHILMYLALPLFYISMLIQSYKYTFEQKNWLELVASLFHLLIPISIISILGLADGLLVLIIANLGFGLVMSLVTMTNHFGLPVIHGDEYKNYSWLEIQTVGSRNVDGGLFIHYLYGGLNTQIEHHIFPHASRFQLLKIAKHTKKFCEENGYTYYSTSPYGAYKEIYDYLKKMRYQG